MYEEVEINSKKELAEYLMNNGCLYVTGEKYLIHFCDDEEAGDQPFLFQDFDGADEPIKEFWDVGSHTYYKKLNWHDCIPKGKEVPCYVSNEFKVPNTSNSVIDCIGYILNDGSILYVGQRENWKYATPIPTDELWVPEL